MKEHQLAKDALPVYEHERKLAEALGARVEDGFWAAKKLGGPIHFWLNDLEVSAELRANPAYRVLYGLLCTPDAHHWLERRDVGKKRDVLSCKRVCRECRMLVVGLGL